jgi:regulator of protease activity HflC (stomatin/prohibitin superfamily)
MLSSPKLNIEKEFPPMKTTLIALAFAAIAALAANGQTTGMKPVGTSLISVTHTDPAVAADTKIQDRLNQFDHYGEMFQRRKTILDDGTTARSAAETIRMERAKGTKADPIIIARAADEFDTCLNEAIATQKAQGNGEITGFEYTAKAEFANGALEKPAYDAALLFVHDYRQVLMTAPATDADKKIVLAGLGDIAGTSEKSSIGLGFLHRKK